ncbi:MFS transporter [Flavobacterium aquidurense]|jgi:Arabinose efflux permease|uniref:MFS transporter n=1 Tax=Flavobacterium aquidurense TaxID=362413 RepID=UPI00285FF105|nr:MFS transporter [Flavobacterium aquidurense]MDR7369906.1 putative MFS family arabinose efflux permease [Flavobacterium aquidurense]
MTLLKELSQKQIIIMSATAGICVANIYYSQPILNEIAKSLMIEVKSTGFISVLSQAGYGLGLFFITPLGDKIARKKLILWLQLSLIVSLLIMATASNITTIYIASLAIGLFAVTAQVILPMAASLVSENRGKIVGIIFTGILVGVLAARVVSGYIAEWLGWRYVYIVSALLVSFSAILMQTDFPGNKERFEGSYTELLRSVLCQFQRFATLRRTALVGALTFGTLSSFWVTLTFHLSGSPFNYKSDTIGLFGLLAVGSTMLVPLFGKLSDKGNNPERSLIIAMGLILTSIIALAIFPDSLGALWFAIILIDIGVQAAQVTNIALIYTLDTSANSRINTVYMTSYFIGGALGAYIGILCWNAGGWLAVTIQMALFITLALSIVFATIIKTQLYKKQQQ